MAEKSTKGKKKNAAEFRASPHQIQIGNHLSYLFQTAQTVLLTTADLNLVRHLIKQIRIQAQKKQIRLHPEMKRLICNCCDMILWPPLTAQLRFDEKTRGKKRGIHLRCSTCGRTRFYGNRHAWPQEYGAHLPSDWSWTSS